LELERGGLCFMFQQNKINNYFFKKKKKKKKLAVNQPATTGQLLQLTNCCNGWLQQPRAPGLCASFFKFSFSFD
jgi:hypothetical protein